MHRLPGPVAPTHSRCADRFNTAVAAAAEQSAMTATSSGHLVLPEESDVGVRHDDDPGGGENDFPHRKNEPISPTVHHVGIRIVCLDYNTT